MTKTKAFLCFVVSVLLTLISIADTQSAPSCPGAPNGTLYTNSAGTQYTIYCDSNWTGFLDIDFDTTSFDDCTRFCDRTPGCEAALWDRFSVCYAKPSAGEEFSGDGYYLALRYFAPTSTAAVTSTTTTTSETPVCFQLSWVFRQCI
ncbi:hypothetical protein TI39_contig669g00019 [Zymoseptoria brevis]|uniref:Apple domain-containing protein n=1 Tax=Zymoseptoria brevis TaxID=1047168 RepID=A0A0F4GH64_9PEZI|nr:hypothetical protein TI39_contig669g00019 [Zymoseptoria brevis]